MVGSYVESCRIVGDLTDPTKNIIFFLWDKFFVLIKLLRVFNFSYCDGMNFYFLFYKIMLT